MGAGMIRAILLDKDGTLTDFRATWDGWLHDQLRDLGAEADASPDALAAAIGYDMAARRMRPDGLFVTATTQASVDAFAAVTGWDRDRVGAWWKPRLDAHAQVPVPGAPEAVRRLDEAGYVLGILTNDERAPALHHLDELGVGGVLAAVVASDDGHGAKPGPGGALAFAETVGLRPSEILVVGDGATDREAARRAGMPFVAVLTGTLGPDDHPGARAVLPDLTGLPTWLRDGSGRPGLTRS